MAHEQTTKPPSTDATAANRPPSRDIEALQQRVTTLERQVRFLMAQLTRDELEQYERVES